VEWHEQEVDEGDQTRHVNLSSKYHISILVSSIR
jgi:hypothetical protein